jgi:PadR family transcriptional regulator, regulatory protein PadR
MLPGSESWRKARTISKIELTMAKMKHQELLKGLIRLHILHHASEAEFYGQWMIHELARHGYTLSPGTLYPMLHGLERRGYLTSKREQNGRTFRRVYRATALGREANRLAKIQVRELIGELQASNAHKPRRTDGSAKHAEVEHGRVRRAPT